MKKLLTALALSSTITAAAYAQRPHTDREDDGLKGPVYSVLTMTATLKKQGERYVEEAVVPAERVVYNAEGNRVEDEWYTDDGMLVKKSAYRYVRGEKLADGRVITPIIHIPNSSERVGGGMRPISERYKYKYDDKGRVREMTIVEDGRVRNRVVYVYQSGRKETRAYDGGGPTLSYRRVDAFDAQGNLVESTTFEPGPDLVIKHTYAAYEFDARGNWVKRLKTESVPGEPEVRMVQYRKLTYF
jgi:hypothetical protein